MTPAPLIDLHTHSVHSDGTLTPEALAERAAQRGVTLWALTDHDDLSGQQRAAAAARRLGVDYLCGVEISVSFAGQTVHVVGLGIDPTHPPLVDGLQGIRHGRAERGRAMGAELARLGLKDAYSGALQRASSPEQLTRTHFARHLIASGHCASMREVFRRYLADGKPGSVPHQWARLADALGWIHGAGGLAVVVHPARYRYTANEEWALFHDFAGHGGAAVEVACASHYPSDVAKYTDLADEFDLLASRGSDFHDPDESRVDLGGGPELPARARPVWQALAHRVLRA